MNEVLQVILWTLTPFLELRFSIPHGIYATSLSWPQVLLIVTITNILLGWLIYALLHLFVKQFQKWNWFNRLYNKLIIRPRKKISSFTQRYGTLGVALFIAIPLPGSGVYTASLGSYVLGVSMRHFMLACVIGVIIASIIITTATLLFKAYVIS